MIRKTKKKPLTALALLKIGLLIAYLPLYLLGQALYYLSKIVRAMGFILMFKKYSARSELSDFLGVWTVPADLF